MAYAFVAGSSAGNASGGAVSPGKPAGTADGDLLIAHAYLESDTNTWATVPSGWTLAGSIANTGSFTLWVYWKVASGEPASWTWTPTTNNWRTITVDAYSGGVTPAVDVVGTGGQADSVTPTFQTAPSLTTVDDNDLVVFSYGNFSGTNIPGMSGFCTNLRTNFGGTCGADATKTPAGATGTSFPSGGGTEDYTAMHIAFKIGTGGTTYTVSISGTLTPAGALIKQANKLVAGTLTPAGLLSKQLAKLIAGTLTPAGLLQKQPSKLMAGMLTPAGAITKQDNKVVVGTLSPTGSISKQDSKLTSGTLTPTGALQKQANKIVEGTLTPSGTLSLIKTVILTLSGTLTPAGSVLNQASKLVAGTLTPAATLIKQVNKILAGTFTPSGALSAAKSTFLKLLDVGGTLTPSGALTKQASKLMSGTLSPTGALLKQAGKVVRGTLTPAGVISLTKVVSKSFSGTLTSTGALRKQANKTLDGTLTPSGGLIKQIRKFFGGVLTSVGAFIGVNNSTTVVQIGYDVADTRRMPVMFEGATAPQLYDRQPITLYYDENKCAVLSVINGSTMIYGE